jgi:molybdopterin synthase sulfur carrier subunit
MLGLYSLALICKNICVTPTGSFEINVLFFGATADAAGARSTRIELQDGATTKQALETLTSMYSRLASHNLLYAVNEEYADGDEVLKAGDKLAVFTAVSGG